MFEIINNPLFWSAPLCAFIVIGGWFLLSWAVPGAQQIHVASCSVGLSLMFLAAYLFGKPPWPMGFGSGSLLAVLAGVTLLSLLNEVSFKIRFFDVLILCLAVWVFLGMPLQAGLVLSILSSLLIMGGCVLGLFATLNEGKAQTDHLPAFIPLLVLGLCGHFYTLFAGDPFMIAFSGSLFFILVIVTVLYFWRRDALLSQVVLNPFYICLGFIFWWLWFYGHLPLIALACLILVPTARSILKGALAEQETARQRVLNAGLLLGVSILPVCVSFVFFFIFQNADSVS